MSFRDKRFLGMVSGLALTVSLLMAVPTQDTLSALPDQDQRYIAAESDSSEQGQLTKADESDSFERNALPGVERSLAQERRKSISDVSYDLCFTVPEEKERPLTVDAVISFEYDDTKRAANRDLILDFEGKVTSARINGMQWTPTIKDEHIIIPEKLLKHGKNTLQFVDCVSLDKALNRRTDHMYTLFVPANARSAFPCFDQPDMKARYDLTLRLPDGWTAVTTGSMISEEHTPGGKVLKFNTSAPLPTYLFSFSAGKFQQADTVIDGRHLEFFHMETDPQKRAQIPEIFRLAAKALSWMEEYTGVEYPFEKFAFVALPDYQVGGMEHPGAIQYKDKVLFLSPTPTPAEIQQRAQVIAHETAHMWFGDLVTMEWFNDVWTKEVFANLMATKATADMFPDNDEDLTFLRTIQTKALDTDVTPGTHAIEQELDNMNAAGLLYGNIIYQKAPVMMRKLEQIMGSERFREGLGEYLQRFSYGNATWDDLIEILSRHAPEANLQDFSRAWVKEAGLPNITCSIEDGKLVVEQSDPLGRGLVWQQSFSVGVIPDNGCSIIEIPVNVTTERLETTLPATVEAVIPNINGDGYGRFILQDEQLEAINKNWTQFTPLNRQAMLMLLYDATLQGQISYERLANKLLNCITEETDEYDLEETNEQILATLCDRLSIVLQRIPPENRREIEQGIRERADQTNSPATHIALTRTLSKYGQHQDYMDVWKNRSDSLLTPEDHINMAYHLAVRHPNEAHAILEEQRRRLEAEKPLLLEEFDFVSRGALPGEENAMQLFESLNDVENRRTENWVLALLALIADESRGDYTLRFIMPALSATEEIRQTGSIFFPANWAKTLLNGYYSDKASRILNEWIANNPDYRPALLRKIKESGSHLLMR